MRKPLKIKDFRIFFCLQKKQFCKFATNEIGACTCSFILF